MAVLLEEFGLAVRRVWHFGVMCLVIVQWNYIDPEIRLHFLTLMKNITHHPNLHPFALENILHLENWTPQTTWKVVEI